MSLEAAIIDPDCQGATVPSAKVNLIGMTLTELQRFMVSIGEKPFRAQQVMKWIHHYGFDAFEDMTNLSKALRTRLADVAEIRAPKIVHHEYSDDGTRKWVVEVDERNRVETVFIPDDGRGTLCVSSQAGCVLDCSFCATGKQGFSRDLTADEIIGQVWLANRSFGVPDNMGNRAITNVVMMGMGEPLLNFDNVVSAMRIMLDDFGYGLSKRRVTLSTSGVVPMMDRLASEIDVLLAVSLHAPNDELRNQLVPVNKKYPLAELMAACQRFLSHYAQRRRITMEYVMLDGVNDKPEHARELAQLLANVPSKINLIPFNPFPHSPYRRSTDEAIERFKNILHDAGFVATIRKTRGDDIDAACGQLVGTVADRTRRSSDWQKVVFKATAKTSRN